MRSSIVSGFRLRWRQTVCASLINEQQMPVSFSTQKMFAWLCFIIRMHHREQLIYEVMVKTIHWSLTQASELGRKTIYYKWLIVGAWQAGLSILATALMIYWNFSKPTTLGFTVNAATWEKVPYWCQRSKENGHSVPIFWWLWLKSSQLHLMKWSFSMCTGLLYQGNTSAVLWTAWLRSLKFWVAASHAL